MWRSGLPGRHPEHFCLDIFDSILNVLQACSLRLVVRIGDEGVYLALVGVQPRVEIAAIEIHGALLTGEDEIEMDSEADPGVERRPGQNRVEEGFTGQEEGHGGPVHQPWCELGGVGCADGLVRGEHREEDGRCSTRGSQQNERGRAGGLPYVSESAMMPNMFADEWSGRIAGDRLLSMRGERGNSPEGAFDMAALRREQVSRSYASGSRLTCDLSSGEVAGTAEVGRGVVDDGGRMTDYDA